MLFVYTKSATAREAAISRCLNCVRRSFLFRKILPISRADLDLSHGARASGRFFPDAEIA